MPTPTAATSGNDCHHPDPATADPLAAAIASGTDLGVFELCSSLAKARQAIPLGSCPRTGEAEQAAIGIRAAFEKVASAIDELDPVEPVCPCCELRRQLDELIEVAAKAEGRGPLADACEELADYAGDHYPDAGATRRVLELACDVFTAAVAELHRPE